MSFLVFLETVGLRDRAGLKVSNAVAFCHWGLGKPNSSPVWSWIHLWYMSGNSTVTIWWVKKKCSGVRTFIGLGSSTIEGEKRSLGVWKSSGV